MGAAETCLCLINLPQTTFVSFACYLFDTQVCTSRFWFNYRHVANTLSVYRSVKRLGIPDR